MLEALRATTLGVIVIAAAATTGCGRPAAQRPRVAVLPLRAVGVTSTTRQAVRDGISRAVRARAELVDNGRVDRQAAGDERCHSSKPAERTRCAAKISASTAARFAVIGALGRLGQTHLLQLGLFDARSGKLARSVERTLEGGGDATKLAQASRPLARALLGPIAATPAPHLRGKPWYRRAWVWIVAGALVAGAAAAVAVPLLLRDGSSGDPYENIPLP